VNSRINAGIHGHRSTEERPVAVERGINELEVLAVPVTKTPASSIPADRVAEKPVREFREQSFPGLSHARSRCESSGTAESWSMASHRQSIWKVPAAFPQVSWRSDAGHPRRADPFRPAAGSLQSPLTPSHFRRSGEYARLIVAAIDAR
jgi:hypothetical protein